MELKDYIRVIRRRWWYFLTVMAVVMGGYFTVATMTEKKVFYARVELFVNPTRTSKLFEGLADYFPDSSKMNPETRIEQLKTKEIQQFAALYLMDERFTVGGDYLFAEQRRASDERRPSFRRVVLASLCEKHPEMTPEQVETAFAKEIEAQVDGRRTLDPETGEWEGEIGKWQTDLMNGIAAAIDRTYGVEKVEKTQLVRITVRSDSAGKVVAVANALSDTAIQYNREFDNRQLIESRAKAKRKIVEKQEHLSRLYDDLKKYWADNHIAQDGWTDSPQYYDLVISLQKDVDTLEGELRTKDVDQAKLEKKRDILRTRFPEFSLPKDSKLGLILQQLSLEERNLEALKSKYNEPHPDVKRTRQAIAELKEQHETALREYQTYDAKSYQYDNAVMEIERDFLKQEIERKKTLLARYNADRANVDKLRLDEQEMKERIKLLEDEIKRLTNFVSLSELYADSAAKPVDRFARGRLDPAKDAWEESTDIVQMMWFMAVVAFLMSVGVVFLVEYMDTTLKTEHDIRRHLNLPVLGIIPHQLEGDGVLLTELKTKDNFAEKFYTSATIIKSAAQDLGLKTFVVSSTVPKEGKTTISVNLGIAMARKGIKVIVVDSDLRIPQIHELLGLDNAYGLSSILEGRLKAKEVLADITDPGSARKVALQSFLQTTGEANLQVLTSGPIPADPLNLLESTRMKALVEELSAMADFVIFDTPPLSNVGDTLTLAGLSDATIFVVGAGACEQHQVTWAKHLLSNVEANVLGCFLNHATIEGQSYYYYYNEYKSYRARG